MDALFHLWVYLETTPLLGLAATLGAFVLAQAISRQFRGHVLASPVLLAITALVLLLALTGTPYAAYFEGAKYVHFLLGPATVALAIPMYANLARIRGAVRGLLPAILAGSVAASVSAMLVARLLGAPPVVVLSLGPKSVTTPIAMGIAEQIGGNPSLAAVFVLITGLVATLLLGALRAAGIRDPRAVGLAGGTAGHGLATAHLLLTSQTAAAFGGVAIGLNGLLTALLLPLLAGWLG